MVRHERHRADLQGRPGQARQRAAVPHRRAPARGRRPRARPGASTPTATSSGSSARPTASGSPTSSTRSWPSTPASSSRCRTRSPPSTARCCRASRCASCWPTTPAPARRSWPACFIKELIVRGDLERCLDRRPGQPRRAVAGRADREVPPRLRHPHPRQDRGGAHRQPVRRERPRHRPARQAEPQRGRPGASSTARRDWDLVVCRRGAQACRPPSSAARSSRRSATSSASSLGRITPALPPDDRDAAQRQGRGLPALHGAARRRPLRGHSSATASTSIDAADLMRRLVKEELLKFDGTPLFPERRAYIVDVRALRRRGRALQATSPTTSARR